MIDINKLKTEDYGRWVKYKKQLYGRIKSWDKKYIFIVCIGILIQDGISWENSSYIPVNPENLKFVKKPTKLFVYK